MANIPSNLTKINDLEVSDNAPVSEATFNKLGAAINYVVDFFSGTPVGFQRFTASGPWVAPANVKAVICAGIGGGGGGGRGQGTYGGGGGGSGVYGLTLVPVTPGQSYNVVIGTGGNGNIGQNGTATTFGGTLANFAGGLSGNGLQAGRGGNNGTNGVINNVGGQGGGGFGAGAGNFGLGGAPNSNPEIQNSGAGGGGGGADNTGGATGANGNLLLFWFTQISV